MAVHFEHAGHGEPVLLIQGTGVAGCAWAPQVEGLRDSFELAWFDNPGVGKSPGPPGDMQHMVAAALEVLDALGWGAAHVAGHSLGGLVAQRLVLDHPDRVRSLALLNTLAQGRATLSFSPAAMWHQLRMLVGTHASRRRAFFEFVSTQAPTEANIAALEAVFGRSLAALPPAARDQVRTLIGADYRSELGSVKVPAVVIGATHDQPAPIEQSRLLAEGLGCPLHVFDGGHALPVERADEVNAVLREFWLG
ncbi:MAG: alpha/beta fold hydrolase [Nannocystaceae bacterium]|nr:alpha/beta fold hydrolase [bacterium]